MRFYLKFKKLENLEELNKEQVMDLASFFGLKSKNSEVFTFFLNIVKT